MLFLPREMFKAKRVTFIIRFGKPIVWHTFDLLKSPQQLAQIVENEVYNII